MGDKSHGTCDRSSKDYVRLREVKCDFIETKSCSNGIRGQLDPSEFKYVRFSMSKVQKKEITYYVYKNTQYILTKA